MLLICEETTYDALLYRHKQHTLAYLFKIKALFGQRKDGRPTTVKPKVFRAQVYK